MIMDRKLVILAIAMGMAVGTGYIFASRTDRRPIPTISDFTMEIIYSGGFYEVVFRGAVVNPLNVNIYDVCVTVHWSEMGNIRHADSTNIGDVSLGGSVDFEISYKANYMLIVQSASPTLEFS